MGRSASAGSSVCAGLMSGLSVVGDIIFFLPVTGIGERRADCPYFGLSVSK